MEQFAKNLVLKLRDIQQTANCYIAESEKVLDILKNLIIKTSLVKGYDNSIIEITAGDVVLTIVRTKIVKNKIEKLTNMINDLNDNGDIQ